MTVQSYKLESETTLNDSITLLRRNLTEVGFNIVEHSYTNPVNKVWSVQLNDRDCSLLASQGKGSSKEAALLNALFKFIAHLSTRYFWANCYFGDEISNSKLQSFSNEEWFKTEVNGGWPKNVLNDNLRGFYNPEKQLNVSSLIDTNTANRSRGICCIPFENNRSEEWVNFPINIITNLYDNNGIAAASSIEEAQLKSLLKIIGNYIKCKVISEGISLPNIPEQILNRYTELQTAIKELKESDYTVLVHDASFGGKYPVVMLTLLNPKNQGIVTSFGSHPKFEFALQQAINELLKGRNLDQLHDLVEAGFNMDEISSPQNLESHFKNSNGIISWSFLRNEPDFEFTDWDTQDAQIDNSVEFKQLCDIIHEEGNNIFISSHNEFGTYTCQIIVPGMSEVYPLDDLVWENNNAGIHVRKQILKTNKTLVECEKLIEYLEDLNLDDHLLISELINMPADADSIFADLRVAELITLLALKTQDNERTQEGCEWLIHFQQIEPHRLKTYQCINTILQLDGMANYSNTLEQLYSRPILNDALALIDGEDIFPLVSDWKLHQQMIDAYKKVTIHPAEAQQRQQL